MKTYFRNGARGYMYWNMAVESGVKSTWGWSQNSLVLVDSATRTYRYTPDYYLLKHLTHFVDVGASLLSFTGTCDDALAFRNPDGSVALLLCNELPQAKFVQIDLGAEVFAIELPPDSLSTVAVGRQAG